MSATGTTKPPNPNAAVGAVLVVGGGIGGMQSALDLAESGYQVILVEKSSAVGGSMVQLDKTFPTNDCSMCTISPRLVALGLHPNIRVLTGTTVIQVGGEAPRFSVTLRHEPRYVDTEKCKACGECEKVCPIEEPNAFNLGLSKRKAIFKLYPQAVPNAFAIEKRGTAPCRDACPAHVSVQGYVALARQGKYAEALALIRRELPLPSVCGRVCLHPCEVACGRSNVDQAVSIRAIKRFLADYEAAHGAPAMPKPEPRRQDLKVAVIGAGPAGLSAAYFLVLAGIPVTLFEALPEPGGMLLTGVPEYRLPRQILRAEINGILGLGVELLCNVRLGKDFTIQELLQKKGFSAVFVSPGAHASRRLAVPGEDLPGVQHGVEFLRSINAGGRKPVLGGRVVVIGGGNVAVDVARTARRLGAKPVEMVCLEQRHEMPAIPDEVAEALEEGISIRNGWGPVRILGSERVTGIELKRCTRVFDPQGRFMPEYDEGQLSRLDADQIIVAIGQAVEDETLEQLRGSTGRNLITVDPVTLQTSMPKVFAGGDAVSGPQSAIEAVAMGKRAAASIRAQFLGERLHEDWGRLAPKVEPRTEGADPKPRTEGKKRCPDERILDFVEVAQGLTAEQVTREAERCLRCAVCSECNQCVTVCEAKAIFHEDRAREETVEVGAIVLAPGFEQFAAARLGEFGYGRYRNVLTGLEFERLLSSSGPTGGQVRRLSDGKHPRRLAWIQCVGSRDKRGGRDFCSAVCCMAATKQASLTVDHDPQAQATVFFMEQRAYGKGFEEYFERARDRYHVRYLRSMVSRVDEDPSSGDLEITWVDEAGGVKSETFDMLVLSTGLKPPESTLELAKVAGIDLDRHGFAATSPFNPGMTRRPGVFVAGVIEGPRDIPETVMSASGAAAMSSVMLRDARGTLVRPKSYPPEKDVSGQIPRVGVFVCRCGINIARVIDVPAMVEAARKLPGVVFAEENLYTCSADTQRHMIEMVREHDLNRVVVASCTPRTHEPLFRETCRDAGLNQYLFEMANIRDQCSWVHVEQVDLANEKAKDLIAMAVRRAATLEPLEERPYAVVKQALVLGGGLAGMTAAEAMAGAGYGVTLVERGPELGGMLRRMRFPLEGTDPQAHLQVLERRVRSHPLIAVLTGSGLAEVGGHVGHFTSRLETPAGPRVVEHGVILVATGAIEYRPEGEYLYGQDPRVLTQREFEERAGVGELPLSRGGCVMIQCVGSREPGHPACSRTCCTDAMRNAIWIKEQRPELPVTVLYRELRTYGLREALYSKARSLGVQFIRYSLESKPEVSRQGKTLAVRVLDPVLGRTIVLEPDLLLLSAGRRPDPQAADLSRTLKVPLGQDGFFLEAHLKLRPLDCSSEGVFLAGLAHGPKTVDEIIVQARGAAGRAGTILGKERLFISGQTSVVDGDHCAACLTCVRVCPYGVPVIQDGVAFIDAASCHGCGTCAAACPRLAITTRHVADAQINAKLQDLFSEAGAQCP